MTSSRGGNTSIVIGAYVRIVIGIHFPPSDISTQQLKFYWLLYPKP